MRRILTLCILALALAACGSTNHAAVIHLTVGPAACRPAAGQGHPGVCAPKLRGLGLQTTLSGPLIVDVYEGNGCKNWAAAKGHIAGAVVKAVEYRQDGCLAANWRGLTAAHIWHAAYDFLRPGSCTAEADAYVAIVDAAGGFNSGPPVADAEVALPGGFVACWVARVKHDLGVQTVIVYTAPGTWPGGGNPGADLWVASYGPSPGCVWTCSHVAWQFTDGTFGPQPHCTVIGCGDISTDNGMTGLLAHPAPPVKPRVRCFGPRARHTGVCSSIRARVGSRSRARDATIRALVSNRCTHYGHIRARDYRSVEIIVASSRGRRPLCNRLAQRAGWFENRVHHDLQAY